MEPCSPPKQCGAPPHTPARSLAGALRPAPLPRGRAARAGPLPSKDGHNHRPSASRPSTARPNKDQPRDARLPVATARNRVGLEYLTPLEEHVSKKISSAALALVAAGFLCSASAPVVAQWLKYPTAGVPRTRDGKPSLTAPTPRTRDGKPDFSGMWLTADGLPCNQQSLGRGVPGVRCGTADLALRHQHGRGHAGRPPVPAVGGAAGQDADRAELQGRSACPLHAGHVRAFVRLAAHAEVHPDARPARDARRAECELPPGLHRRTAAAERSPTVVAGIFDPASGSATRSSWTQSDSATACGSTSSAAR